ncbi:solute carrier family 25 protein [archaeon]|nr:MAG: solute carrier family 25 protein [archaeon]
MYLIYGYVVCYYNITQKRVFAKKAAFRIIASIFSTMTTNSTFREIVAGANAGIVGTVLGYPLDAIKTNMQTSQNPMRQVVRDIYSRDSFAGFYRGVAAPLLALTMLNTLNFSSYAYFRSVLKTEALEDSKKRFEWRFTLAGACAGPLAAFISTPFEMIKTQQQLGKLQSTGHRGSIQTLLHINKSHGPSGLFVAHSVNTTREIVFLLTYFTVYEHVKQAISNALSSNVAIPMAGGIAGATGWLVSFPLDNIKSNIQGNALQPNGAIIKKPSLQIFKEIMQKKGLKGLYAGVAPSIMRAFIVSASRFTAYELTVQTMDSVYVQE